MKTFLLLCSLISCSSLGEILAARGMQQIGAVSLRPTALLDSIWRMIRNPYLIAGVSFLALSFFSFISLLSYADLSFVVPLTAIGYLTNTIGARFFLKEKVSRERWTGTLLVTCGVALISFDHYLETLIKTDLYGWMSQGFRMLAPEEIIGIEQSQSLFWIIFFTRSIILMLVSASIIYYLLAAFSGLLWFIDRRKQRALGLNYTPAITIFKPVRGVDHNAYENFASFCRQDYPEYQIIFGVRDRDDPAITIIDRLIVDFPTVEIELVVSTKQIGANAKVSNLHNMSAKARHDILLIADSDIRVEPDYLRRVVAPLQEQKVGMVTCLYRGVESRTLASLLGDIGISSTFGPEVCASRALEGIAFALGSTIVMRRELLERIGGFPAVADYLADDFLLGYHTSRAGYQVVLSDCVVEHVSKAESFGSLLRHLVRWGRTVRTSRPISYFGLILTYGTATSLLALLAWNFSSFALMLFASTLAARFLPVLVVGVIGMKDFKSARYFWLVPVRDLITFGVWVYSFFGNRIEWRGEMFRVLRGGKLSPVKTGGRRDSANATFRI